MKIDRDRVLDLAERCLSLTPAEAAEALVFSESGALTRFASNHIHQNVAEENTQVSVRAVLGSRIGVASTNRLDDDSLRQCCEAAAEAASHAPEDPAFPGLPKADPLFVPDRVSAATLAFDPARRAAAAGTLVRVCRERGLVAAGRVACSHAAVAVANTEGVRASMPLTDVRASLLAMGDADGSGWADFASNDATKLDPAQLAERAASLAERSQGPEVIDPGAYEVVLAPNAVATLLDFLAYTGFSAKAVAEHTSFMAGHEGERVFSERVTITDDATASDAMGLTFDFEGSPKRRTPLIEAGVAVGPVTDSYWAAITKTANTGHALPAPNRFGPLPLDLRMDAGTASEDDLIGQVERGIYVTRFHYVNVEDPVRVVLTGMTRDGTFLIEEGKLTRPVKNLRFTQSIVDALSDVRGVGCERRFCSDDEGSPSLAPAVSMGSFLFTGQTR